MKIVETNSDGLRNTVESTSNFDLSYPNQATTPHDGAFGLLSDFPLDLNGLIYLRFRDLIHLNCFPHVLEMPPEDLHYHIRRVPV